VKFPSYFVKQAFFIAKQNAIIHSLVSRVQNVMD